MGCVSGGIKTGSSGALSLEMHYQPTSSAALRHKENHSGAPGCGLARDKEPEHVKRNRAEERACADQCIGFRLTCHLGVLLRAVLSHNLGAFFQTVLSHNEVLRKGSEHFGPSFLDADAPIISWEAAAHDPCAVLPDLIDADPDSEPQGSGDNCGYPEHTAFHYVQDLICT